RLTPNGLSVAGCRPTRDRPVGDGCCAWSPACKLRGPYPQEGTLQARATGLDRSFTTARWPRLRGAIVYDLALGRSVHEICVAQGLCRLGRDASSYGGERHRLR